MSACNHIDTVRCANCIPWGDRYYNPYPNPVPIWPAPAYPAPSQQGWSCPVCGRVMAPWMPTCTGEHPASGPNAHRFNFVFNNNPIEGNEDDEELT